jgi:hypothetical protein
MEQKRYSKEDIEELVKADLNKKGYEVVNIFTHTQGVLVDVKKKEESQNTPTPWEKSKEE